MLSCIYPRNGHFPLVLDTMNVMHPLVLHNDEIVDARDRSISPGQVGFLNGWGVFSTIRVSDGALFAFSRHWERMKLDARKMRVPFPENAEWMRSRLLRLIEANRASNATLRVAVVRNRGGLFEAPGLERDFDLLGFTADMVQWPDGVRLAIKPQARHAAAEFAGTKILSWSHNLTWYEEARARGFDEYLLLNERGEVCECTSANIFAAYDTGVNGTHIWTPPLFSGCLAGVTRAILLEDIRVPEFTIGEKILLPADLERADQVVITSTTRDLLPVVHIEGLKIKTGSPLVRRLQDAFAEYRRLHLRQATEQPAALMSV